MIEVVCAVIDDGQGNYLACLRPSGKHLGGLWEFPGGKVETAESALAALSREIREELGVDVLVGEPLDPVPWKYDRGEILLRPFLCSITQGNPLAIEHERIVWCAPEDFGKLDWAPADLPVLEQIRLL